MSTVGPTWTDKLRSLRLGMEWASGLCATWKFQNDAFQAPENNDPWLELRMLRVFELGPADVLQCDNIDPVTGLPDADNPRAELAVTTSEFICEGRFFGRDQEHDVVAWVVGDEARRRMRLPYFRQTFLDPPATVAAPSPNMALIELFDIVPMPRFENRSSNAHGQKVQQRWQSEAVLEMRLSTTFADDDAASVGTWIEQVEISSDLLQPGGGSSLDPSIQLNNELIDAT